MIHLYSILINNLSLSNLMQFSVSMANQIIHSSLLMRFCLWDHPRSSNKLYFFRIQPWYRLFLWEEGLSFFYLSSFPLQVHRWQFMAFLISFWGEPQTVQVRVAARIWLSLPQWWRACLPIWPALAIRRRLASTWWYPVRISPSDVKYIVTALSWKNEWSTSGFFSGIIELGMYLDLGSIETGRFLGFDIWVWDSTNCMFIGIILLGGSKCTPVNPIHYHIVLIIILWILISPRNSGSPMRLSRKESPTLFNPNPPKQASLPFSRSSSRKCHKICIGISKRYHRWCKSLRTTIFLMSRTVIQHSPISKGINSIDRSTTIC